MKKNVLLLYNPGAGYGKHDENELIKLIEAEGHQCECRSVKEKGWGDIPAETEWIAVAGGDSTVRKVMERIQEQPVDDPVWPLGILPLGTTNNIAGSFGLTDLTAAQLVKSWGANSTRFNTATVSQGGKDSLMCEAMGFGFLPAYILDKKKKASFEGLPEERVKEECRILLESLKHIKAKHYEIGSDGLRQAGHYISLQVMNIPLAGPDLLLTPQADPSDGLLDLVAFTIDDRAKLARYLRKRIEGKQPVLEVETVRLKKIQIHTTDERYHIDDNLFSNDASRILEISVNARALKVFVPGGYRVPD